MWEKKGDKMKENDYKKERRKENDSTKENVV